MNQKSRSKVRLARDVGWEALWDLWSAFFVKAFRALLRTEPYHPILLKITGSASCGILLSQLYFYWGINNKDWFCETNEHFCKETGLTIKKLKTAKAKLVKLGFIKTERRGFPPKIWYFVDCNMIINEISKI